MGIAKTNDRGSGRAAEAGKRAVGEVAAAGEAAGGEVEMGEVGLSSNCRAVLSLRALSIASPVAALRTASRTHMLRCHAVKWVRR